MSHYASLNKRGRTGKQMRQFQQWIIERKPWLCFETVNSWWIAKADIHLHDENGDKHIPIIREALCRIALDLQMKHSPNATVMLPGFGHPLEWMPAMKDRFPVIITNEGLEWTAETLLIREMCMLKVIEEITMKPDWWKNARNAHITNSWKEEILALDWEKYMTYADFTSPMAEQCIKELELKADLYEKTGLVPVLDYSSCVIISDKAVSEELKRAFSGITTELKDVKSYTRLHDGCLIIHQAHASLSPLVYGRSRILPCRRINRSNCLEACGEGDILPKPRKPCWDMDYVFRLYDNSYQWLPFDVTISKDGNARIDSYINNLHPVKDKRLYSVISKAVNHALPAWDIVYRWPHQFSFQRIAPTGIKIVCCARDDCGPGHRECKPSNMSPEETLEYEIESLEYEKRLAARAQRKKEVDAAQTGTQANEDATTISKCQPLDLTLEHSEKVPTVYIQEESLSKWYIDHHPVRFPKLDSNNAHHFRLRSSDVRSSGFFLQENERIQVMVTFGEIHVTPENPEYKGGTWETDGQLNEHIVCTALFCYDVENITNSYLYFGAITDGHYISPAERHPEDLAPRAFGIFPRKSTLQVLGRVRVHPDNAIFYPNIYKHRQGSFSLVDRSKKGFLKYFKLHLVDPAIPIISTANVPPQNYAWWTKNESHNQGLDIVRRLPPELKERIHSYVDFPIDSAEEDKIYEDIRRRRNRIGEQFHSISLHDIRFDIVDD